MAPRLTHTDHETIRELSALGHPARAIAAAFDVTVRRINQILGDPPTSDEIEDAKAARLRVEQLRDESLPRFAGFVGPQAEFIADLFNCEPDGGCGLYDGDGNLRDEVGNLR